MKSNFVSYYFYIIMPLTLLTLLTLSPKGQATELIACGHPYYPPVSWLQNNEIIGVAPAVVKLIFGELGYQVRLDMFGNWKRCLREVKTGHADIVVAAYRIKSREPHFDFSQQHIVADPIGAFVNPKHAKDYRSLDDLKGKTVGLLFGDSFGDSLDKFIEANNHIEYVSKGKQNFEKFVHGRIDFMLLGILSGQLQTMKFAYNKQIIAAPLKLDTQYYYLALSPHSQLKKHLPYINQRLQQLHQSGKIQGLLTEYSHLYLKSSTDVDADKP